MKKLLQKVKSLLILLVVIVHKYQKKLHYKLVIMLMKLLDAKNE